MMPLIFQAKTAFTRLAPGARIQLIATFLNSAGGIVKLFLPLYFFTVYGFDLALIGWMMALYGGGCVVGAYCGGMLTSRCDARWTTGLCLLLSGLFALLMTMRPSTAWLVLLVPATGLFDGAFQPGNLRLIMESCAKQQRAWIQGVHRVTFNLGIACAGILAGALASHGYHYMFLCQGLANLLGGIWLLCHAGRNASFSQEPVQGKPDRPAPARRGSSPWRDPPFLLFILGQLLALAIFDQMYGTLGLFLKQEYRVGSEWIGYLFSINALLVVLFQLPVSVRIARFGVATSSRLGLLLLGAAFPMLNLGLHVGLAVLAMILITAAELLLAPAWMLLVMQRSEQRDRGKYLGIFSAAWLGHSLYGPAAGAWIYGLFGASMLWWSCALLGALVFIFHSLAIPALNPDVD